MGSNSKPGFLRGLGRDSRTTFHHQHFRKNPNGRVCGYSRGELVGTTSYKCCVAFNKLKKKVRIKRQKIGYFDFWPVLFCIKLIGKRKHPHLWLWLHRYTSSVHCIKTFDVPHRKASENGTTRLPCLCWCSCRLGRWCSSGCGGSRFSLRWSRP